MIPVPSAKKCQRVVEKEWGTEYWLENSPRYCAKVLCIVPGRASSLHYHPKKTETFFVMRGDVWLELGDNERRLWPGDFVTIEPGEKHRFRVPANAPQGCAYVFEASTQHDEGDVVRLEPSGAA